MMTPEERAQALVNALGYQWTPHTVSLVAAAIRAAMEAEREACARVCDALAIDLHDQFKGRGRHAPNNDGRADPYVEGKSDGADSCAAAIRARGEER